MRRSLLLILTTLNLLAGCLPGPRQLPARSWQYADLRLIDPIEGVDPQFDLIAAYARCAAGRLDVRLDLLESIDPWSYDFYLAVDDRPGGASTLPIGGSSDLRWDRWIAMQAGEPVEVISAAETHPLTASPRAWRNTRLDTVQLQLPVEDSCNSNIRMQAFITPAGSDGAADTTEPFALGNTPPEPANVLLAFWDTLPGITPAQALRRWNGAHTGPYGQRHGLAVLLDAVEVSRVPIALLDLTQPSSLSALEAVSGTARVRELAGKGLLTLVQNRSEAAVSDRLFDHARAPLAAFDLPGSSLVFERAAGILHGQPLHVFAGSGTTASLSGAEGPSRQADEGGLTLAVKTALIQAALSGYDSGYTLLGGSLPESEWADAEIARPALEYFAAHPWIHPLTGYDLAAMPKAALQENNSQTTTPSWLCAERDSIRGTNAAGQPLPLSYTALRNTLEAELNDLPQTPFTDQAWQAWSALTAPTADCALVTLRANYLGELGYLIAAAGWAVEPGVQTDCSTDLDFDGEPECRLSGPDAFAVIEPDGARLTFAALRTSTGAFQVTGTQSQFGVGLSDPLAWRLDRGPRADPDVVSGAFDDGQPFAEPYQWEIAPGEIRFTHPQTGVQKTYTLFEGGLQVTISGMQGQDLLLPLVVAPEARFQPHWPARYFTLQSASNVVDWGFGLVKRVEVEVEGAAISLDTFRDSKAAMRRLEDPDFEYPEGHYLPFPIALLTIHADQDFCVTLRPKEFP